MKWRATGIIKPWVAQAIYSSVALLWLVPDRLIEHALEQKER